MLFVNELRLALADQRILRGNQWRGSFFRRRLFLDLEQRFEPHLAVMVKPGAERDNVTHDHIFLETSQVIDPGARGRLGEDPGGVLERSGAEEAFGLERRLGDTEQHRLRLGRFPAHFLHALVLFLELKFVDLLSPQEGSVTRLGDANLAEHLADDDFDVLVVNGHTLQAVNLLHFVDQMFLQLLRAADVEDLVGVNGAFGELLAFLDIIAFEHDDVLADWNEVLFLYPGLLIFDEDATFAPDAGTEVHDTVDLGDLRGVLGPARLKQFGNPRQTAGDILGLGGFARRLGHERAGDDPVPLGDDNVRSGRNRVIGRGLVLIIEDDDLRVQIFFVFDDDHGFLAGGFIHLLFHGHPLNDVGKFHFAGFLGEKRDIIRIPLDEGIPFFNAATVLNRDH